MRRSLPSPQPAAFPPLPPPPTWSALFGASSVLLSRPTPPAFRGGFALLSFPSRPGTAWAAAGDRRSPRFRRDPFVRELVSDPGRAAVPRITAPLILPSALWTASAPALKLISWLNTDPTRSLCTLRRGRHLPRRNTRYRRALPLTWTGLSPAGPRQLCLAHPDLSQQLILADPLARPLKQRDEEIKGAASDAERLASLEQKALAGQQS